MKRDDMNILLWIVGCAAVAGAFAIIVTIGSGCAAIRGNATPIATILGRAEACGTTPLGTKVYVDQVRRCPDLRRLDALLSRARSEFASTELPERIILTADAIQCGPELWALGCESRTGIYVTKRSDWRATLRHELTHFYLPQLVTEEAVWLNAERLR